MKFANLPLFRSCFLLLVFLLMHSSAARADNLAEAKEAFTEGQSLFDNAQYEKATEAFMRAMALAPNWKLHYNIAQCNAAAKDYGAALRHFEQYMTKGGDEIAQERVEEVLREMEKLRQMVGVVEFANIPDGSELHINGKAHGMFPLVGQLRLAAGVEHQVLVTLEQDVLINRTVVVGATQTITLQPKMQEEGESSSSLGDDDVPNSNQLKPLKVVFWISSALTVAAAGAGIGLWAAADSKNDELSVRNEMILSGQLSEDDPAAHNLKNSVDSLDSATRVSFICAGVLGATAITIGIVYLAKNKKNKKLSVLPTLLSVRF